MTMTRVLVVDDEPDARELLAMVFETEGLEVAAVGSVPEAVAALAEARFDVLVSDIGMPGEDGYSLIARIRAREAASGRRLPAVAVTAYTRPEDRARALAAGFDLHVAKPVDPARLVADVRRLIAR